jgi:hypothetical protein
VNDNVQEFGDFISGSSYKYPPDEADKSNPSDVRNCHDIEPFAAVFVPSAATNLRQRLISSLGPCHGSGR